MSGPCNEDGDYRFRQSWLNTFAKCPEQARVEMFDPKPRGHTDSTALGTAVHSGADYVMAADMVGADVSLPEVREIVRRALERMEWKYTKFSAAKVFELADQAICTWWREARPLVRPAASEWEFEVPFITPQGREVTLTGTADTLDSRGFPVDWKTGGQPYEHWEYQRWAVQPTVYCYALDWMWHNSFDLTDRVEEPTGDFTYHVMLHDGTHQQLDVTRDARHYAWLGEQLDRIVDLIEADLPHWPLVDSGWHCSPRWCPNWSDCKGAVMGAGDAFKH